MTSKLTKWVAAAAVSTAALAPQAAHADEVSPTGKGIAGGVLLGAEVVMIPMAVADVDVWWAYLLGGGLGAAGGAVGGYFVEQSGVAEPSLYMLAGGLALVIPTVVLTINATAYKPEVGEGEIEIEGGPTFDDFPPLEDEIAPAEESATLRRRYRPYVPPSFVGLDITGRELRVRPGVPAIGVRQAYSAEELARYGVEQHTEVSVSLLTGRF